MDKTRRICVITGTRAEFGLLLPLLREIEADARLQLQLAVTGMHLSPEFGLTYQEIEESGFVIDERVEMLLSSDTAVGVTKALGLATIGFADAFVRLRPDIVVVLGDRFEILAAAQAALIAGIPLAHLHGGEVTEGAFDESIRHAVTKMAHYHFTGADTYRHRVIQMGEQPDRVFAFGAPVYDVIARTEWLSRNELQRELGVEFRSPTLLVTYHPETLAARPSTDSMADLCAALDMFPGATVYFTKANADTDGRALNDIVDRYVSLHQNRVFVGASLGQRRYLSLARAADVVIGNSSSGVIEAPAVGTPTVNIGNRQKGRARAPSIIDVPDTRDAIVAGIHAALTAEYQERARKAAASTTGAGASARICEMLATLPLVGAVKRFHDLPPAT